MPAQNSQSSRGMAKFREEYENTLRNNQISSWNVKETGFYIMRLLRRSYKYGFGTRRPIKKTKVIKDKDIIPSYMIAVGIIF